jgi:hypothetical protein
MASSGKSVDPILIGIIFVGIAGAVAFYFMGDGQKPTPIPPPEKPVLTASTAPKMEGNAAMWGGGTGDQGGGPGGAAGPMPSSMPGAGGPGMPPGGGTMTARPLLPPGAGAPGGPGGPGAGSGKATTGAVSM